MATKKKIYAVARGRKPGIYTIWSGSEGAQSQVIGFPDARYKGFYFKDEAEQWLKEIANQDFHPQQPKAKSSSSSPKRSDAKPLSEPSAHISASDVIIYTDGSSRGNPGPGGYGVVLLTGEKKKSFSNGFRRTTNNRMELLACIIGLESLKKEYRVTLFSDSKYVVDSVNKKWVFRWKKNGWKRNKECHAENIDLWERFLEAYHSHTVEMRWVKGHAGNPNNELCDKLATEAADQPKEKLEIDSVFEKNH
jgi:ribonuclease HI